MIQYGEYGFVYKIVGDIYRHPDDPLPFGKLLDCQTQETASYTAVTIRDFQDKYRSVADNIAPTGGKDG